MKTKKKRNPTDSTMRNVRAANKRIGELELIVAELKITLELFMWEASKQIDEVKKALEKKRGKK